MLRKRTLFKYDVTSVRDDKKHKVKIIYLYRDNGTVWMDFRNESEMKGIAIDVDSWFTLLHRLDEVSRRLKISEEYSSRLTEDVFLKVNKFMRECYVHIRQYYVDTERQWQATARGMSFNEFEWENFLDVIGKIKKDLILVSSLPNCEVEDTKYTLVSTGYDKNEEVFRYLWIEKMVVIKSEKTDLSCILAEHMESVRKRKEVVQEEQENKRKVEKIAQNKCMFGAIYVVQEKEGSKNHEGDMLKSRIVNLYFRCGESMEIEVFDPLVTYNVVLEKYSDIFECMLDGKPTIPDELQPYVGMCRSLYLNA